MNGSGQQRDAAGGTESGRTYGMVSIVVPTYREAENLEELVARLREAMCDCAAGYEIIVVDDDSRDGTEEEMQRLAEVGHPVRLITRREERGLSSAVLRGFEEANGATLVCMDADLSHPPEAVPHLVEHLQASGADFVIGSRYVEGGSTQEGWGLFRWLNSKVATLLARPFTRARDPMAGFFVLPREVFERAAALDPVGYKIGLELIVKCNCRDVQEVPIHFANRKRGESKLSFKEQVNYLRHLKRLADHKFGGFSQLFQFCLVGGTGMVLDLVLYGTMLHLGLLLPVARAVAIVVAMTWNFVLNRLVTFGAWGTVGVLRQYGRFVASCGLGAAVSWSMSVGLVALLPDFSYDAIICAVAGIAAGTLVNFTLSRYWVFARLQTPDGSQVSKVVGTQQGTSD